MKITVTVVPLLNFLGGEIFNFLIANTVVILTPLQLYLNKIEHLRICPACSKCELGIYLNRET